MRDSLYSFSGPSPPRKHYYPGERKCCQGKSDIKLQLRQEENFKFLSLLQEGSLNRMPVRMLDTLHPGLDVYQVEDIARSQITVIS